MDLGSYEFYPKGRCRRFGQTGCSCTCEGKHAMNNALARAAALQELIRRPAEDRQRKPLAEAVVRCCQDLLDAGEPFLALSLSHVAREFAKDVGRDWLLRLSIVQSEALRKSGEFDKALLLLSSMDSSPY